ncbi:hypothetical protein NDU88_007553 [Pleurodeles waltl]|uniref:Uncharacterized protein n=1 Tax=Pleurodeles waltl TaxID=8319 RepID=A0AAV7QP57_PLEWA|nr:hypothetical protein NDU88_007552 [Pleurodeles waltl]KAJ1141218.1 hypothetical protein NDU88_007553 [Pleurodeles waltl]
MAHLTDARVGDLEGEVSLEELQEALGGMASGNAPDPDGMPVECYRTYSAMVLPRLLDIRHEQTPKSNENQYLATVPETTFRHLERRAFQQWGTFQKTAVQTSNTLW